MRRVHLVGNALAANKTARGDAKCPWLSTDQNLWEKRQAKAQENWVKNSAHYANNSIRMAHMIAARFWSQKGSAAPISGIT